MTGLESIISQIEGDARQEASERLEAVKAQAEELLEKARSEADEKTQAILREGERQSQDIRDRAKSAAQLARRNAMLTFKLQLIREAIDNTRASLENAPDKEYFDTLLRLAARFAPQGPAEMKLNRRDLDRLPANFADELKKAVPQADITISDTPEKIDSGFLLICGGIDINCTFRAIFEDAEGELRDAVGRILFPAE